VGTHVVEQVVGSRAAPSAFRRGVRAAAPPLRSADPQVVTEADLAPLPAAVRRYLRFMAVVGRPRDRSLQAHLVGSFRRRPDAGWMPCEAWQYTAASPPARMFRMRLRLGGWLPMTGWDTYLSGHGRMRGTLLGVVPVARGSGPYFDVSELVTWLNDAVLMAPSMLLTPATTWTAGPDGDSFDVTFAHAGRSVSARVLLDDRGAPREFWTDDRYADLPGGLQRVRWRTPVEGWTTVEGRPRMTAATAVWELLGGPFCYGRLILAGLRFDVAPR
jgi:hypothetical protein